MEVSHARFVTSAVDPAGYPPPDLPEVCFAGRSNVGKSSLLNVLMNRRRLVDVSSRPGKTRLVNFFVVDDAISFVDLPGYGYAKISKAERAAFRPMVERYLSGRTSLRACAVLVDARRGPGDEEIELLGYLREQAVRPIVVATKVDKLRASERSRKVQSLADRMGLKPRAVVSFSAVTREGRDELWRRIQQACR